MGVRSKRGRCRRRSALVRIRRCRHRSLLVIWLHRWVLRMIHRDHLRSRLWGSLLGNLVGCLGPCRMLRSVRRSGRMLRRHFGVAGYPRTLWRALIVRISEVDSLSWPDSWELLLGKCMLWLLGRGWHQLCRCLLRLGELGAVVAVCLGWPRDDHRTASGRTIWGISIQGRRSELPHGRSWLCSLQEV